MTLATALIEAPDWLPQAYRESRCRGMKELYELRRLHGQHAQAVADWVSEQGELITRDRIAALRVELCGAAVQESPDCAMQDDGATRTQVPSLGQDEPTNPAAGTRPPTVVCDALQSERSPSSDRRIHVEFDWQPYQLVVSVAPEQPGHLYVRPLVGGPRRLAPASALKLLGFVSC